jgi:hypothetical protein
MELEKIKEEEDPNIEEVIYDLNTNGDQMKDDKDQEGNNNAGDGATLKINGVDEK